MSSPATPFDPNPLLRLGILTLPLGNALKLVGNLGTFDSVGYGIPPATEASVAAGPGFFVGELVGSVLPTLLSLFGVFALFGYLAARAGRRIVVAGLVCSTFGAGVTLAALGVINYAIPALAHAFQHGDADAMAVADGFFAWPWGAILYPAVLVPIGFVLFAVALWRSTTVPRVAVLLMAVGVVCMAVPFPIHSFRLAGGALGLVAGLWVALAIRRDLAPAAVSRHSAPFHSQRY